MLIQTKKKVSFFLAVFLIKELIKCQNVNPLNWG